VSLEGHFAPDVEHRLAFLGGRMVVQRAMRETNFSVLLELNSRQKLFIIYFSSPVQIKTKS
jgi:hypothetical protein